METTTRIQNCVRSVFTRDCDNHKTKLCTWNKHLNFFLSAFVIFIKSITFLFLTKEQGKKNDKRRTPATKGGIQFWCCPIKTITDTTEEIQACFNQLPAIFTRTHTHRAVLFARTSLVSTLFASTCKHQSPLKRPQSPITTRNAIWLVRFRTNPRPDHCAWAINEHLLRVTRYFRHSCFVLSWRCKICWQTEQKCFHFTNFFSTESQNT